MKKTKYLILILVLGLFSANFVFAEELSVKFEADKKVMDVSEALKLTLEINGLSQGRPEILMPKLDGFIIISTTAFNKISIVNNKLISLAKTVYFLKATKTGNLIIPEIKVKYKNKEYSASAIEVEVKGILPAVPENKPQDAPHKTSVMAEEATI